MKIAIITAGLLPLPSVKGGAIETLLQYFIDYNEKNADFELDVYSIYDKEAEIESNKYNKINFKYIKINNLIYKISRLLFRILRKVKIYKDPNFEFQFIKKVYKYIKNIKYDYIIIQSENHFANYLLKRTDIPIILHLHNDKLNRDTKNARIISEKLYKIWTVSEYIKNRVLTIDSKLDSKVKVIYNGIKLEEFSDIETTKHDGINYLFVGRVEKEKGVYELVQAFNRIDFSAKLYIVGGAFYSNNKPTKYFKKVKKIANKNVVFTGYIPHNKLKDIYKNIDVQVVPSLWQEPGSLANIEALNSGVTLITTKVGGTPEYVKENAILVEVNENIVENLYQAMIKCNKRNDKIKRNMKYYSDEEFAKRVEKEIKELN